MGVMLTGLKEKASENERKHGSSISYGLSPKQAPSNDKASLTRSLQDPTSSDCADLITETHPTSTAYHLASLDQCGNCKNSSSLNKSKKFMVDLCTDSIETDTNNAPNHSKLDSTHFSNLNVHAHPTSNGIISKNCLSDNLDRDDLGPFSKEPSNPGRMVVWALTSLAMVVALVWVGKKIKEFWDMQLEMMLQYPDGPPPS